MRGFVSVLFVVLICVFLSQAGEINRAVKGDLILKEIIATRPSPERHHFLVTVREKIPDGNDCLQGDVRRREKAAEYCLDAAHGGKYEGGTYVQHQIGNPSLIPQDVPAGYNNARCTPRRNERNERISGIEMTQTFLVQCLPKEQPSLNGAPILPADSFRPRR